MLHLIPRLQRYQKYHNYHNQKRRNLYFRDGFGFDPVFIPHPIKTDGREYSTDGKTFADIDLKEKEMFSHRRKALDGLIQILNESKPASSS